MNEPEWLLPEAVIAVQKRLIAEHGGVDGLRDGGLLESALSRAENRFHYERADLFELAASYGFGLAHDHPFADGNKRMAAVAIGMFLDINGFELVAPEAELKIAMDDLAAGNLTEERSAAWLRVNARPARPNAPRP